MYEKRIIEALATASDDELAQALSDIRAAAKGLENEQPSEELSATLKGYVSAFEQVKAEQNRRAELAADVDAARAVFADDGDDRVTPGPAGDENPGVPPADSGNDEDDGGNGGENEGGSDDDSDQDGSDSGVTAASRRRIGTLRNTKQTDPKAGMFAGKVRSKTVLNGETPGMAIGAELNADKLVEAFSSRFHAIRNVKGDGRFDVARVLFEYPEERILDPQASAEFNTAKIEAANPVIAQQAGLTAALCGPLEPIYDINVLGVLDRPVRDALSRFSVARGGITYRMPFDALNMTSGMGIWTPADDDVTEEPLPTKTCLEVDCPGVVSASLYAAYLCLQFPNFTARFDREWVNATTRASLVAWARFGENELLKRLLAGSKALTAPVQVSATRDILTNIDKVTAYYRYRHRLNSMVPLRLILPRWVLEIMRADLTRGFPGGLDALRVADAQISQFLSARGVNVTWHLDGLDNGTYTIPADGTNPSQSLTIGTQQIYDNVAAGGAIPDFINLIEGLLFAEGDWLYLDGGTLDLGLVRDSTLNSRNRYQTFVETFEGVAFNGIESLRLQMSVEPTGAVVGTIDPPADAPLPVVTP